MTNREIDALVAEKIMGWKSVEVSPDGFRRVTGVAPNAENPNYKSRYTVSYYSTEIADAWAVVEKLKVAGAWLRIGYSSDGAYVELNDYKQHDADTAPMAICLAALRAMGVEV